MHIKSLRIALLCIVASFSQIGSVAASAQTAPTPLLFNLDYADLLSIRDELHAKPASGKTASPRLPAYEKLLAEADQLLRRRSPSVLDKTLTPPSGDKHDYFAIGNYSWPNPDTPDGIPYIRRDGHRNPEAVGTKYDKGAYDTNVRNITTLALAWFYSRDEKYAAKAADLLRTWFIDPATRMNPNFNFAASQPGVHDGEYYGIIEGVVLAKMLDYVQLLTLSQSWRPADNAALQQWFRDFTTWLLESDFGKRERAAPNNHGVWYAAQVGIYAHYTGDLARAKPILANAWMLVDQQIAPDGTFPAELKRPRSIQYIRYVLQAYISLARACQLAGDDLWHYKTPDGRGLEKAFNTFAPYFDGSKEWAWPRMADDIIRYETAMEILLWPAKIYRTPRLVEAARALDPTKNRPLFGKLPSTHRIIWLLNKTPD